MERTGRTRPRSARLVITPGAILLLFGVIVAALLLRNLFVAGRRPIGWAVAAIVLAAAIEPSVSAVSKHMRRGLALLCVLLPLIAGVGIVARGVYQDLDRSTAKLQRAIPQAAASIERSDRFGDAAKDLNLQQRAKEFAAQMERPSSEAADRARGSGSAWLVTTILTIFALGWGPRFGAGALKQITDEERRDRIAHIVGTAFTKSQAYVDAALGQAIVVGVCAWLVFRLFEVPAPTPLALLVAVFSLVPVVGILVGNLPAVMLVAGFSSFGRAGWLLVIALLAQAVQVLVFRSITRRTLYVGPAMMVIAYLVGSDVYGLGGAVFGTAITVFGIALVEAVADQRGVDLRPEDADPTQSDPPPAEDGGPGDAQPEPAGTGAGAPALGPAPA